MASAKALIADVWGTARHLVTSRVNRILISYLTIRAEWVGRRAVGDDVKAVVKADFIGPCKPL